MNREAPRNRQLRDTQPPCNGFAQALRDQLRMEYGTDLLQFFTDRLRLYYLQHDKGVDKAKVEKIAKFYCAKPGFYGRAWWWW